MEIEKIIEIAKEAGEIILKYYKTDFKVENKSNNRYDPVTTADLKSDAHISKRLKEEFPQDEVLSEENCEVEINWKKRVWVVDPIDGTKAFVRKTGGFCILIGLCENSIPVFGLLYLPLTGEFFYAFKGKGAYNNRGDKIEKIHVNDVDEIKNVRMRIKGDSKNEEYDKVLNCLDLKEKITWKLGSFGLVCAHISSGKEEAAYLPFKFGKWDTCAPEVILKEAGGNITDLDGKKLDYSQKDPYWNFLVLASNGSVHKPLLDKIKPKI